MIFAGGNCEKEGGTSGPDGGVWAEEAYLDGEHGFGGKKKMEMEKITLRHISILMIAGKAMALGWMGWQVYEAQASGGWYADRFFWICAGVGFLAQLIDGALGMAYGVSSSSFLLATGMTPAVASASVHVAELFTTGASGLSHLYFRNVDHRLFLRLAIPGMTGSAVGAYLLSDLLDGGVVKPFVAAYLLLLGFVIILKGIREPLFREEIRRVGWLAFAGGLLDSVGGGGWGPIVTTNIIRKGKTPRLTIGTVNTVEFFVALSSAGTFLLFSDLSTWKAIVGLVLGGMLAAPAGAWVVRIIPARRLLLLVGSIIMAVSFAALWTAVR
ncbi:MAG: hypothetical protein RLY31_879 [Bacteroidota bacterium]|jgi:uncharacterized membrane protein YfcA